MTFFRGFGIFGIKPTYSDATSDSGMCKTKSFMTTFNVLKSSELACTDRQLFAFGEFTVSQCCNCFCEIILLLCSCNENIYSQKHLAAVLIFCFIGIHYLTIDWLMASSNVPRGHSFCKQTILQLYQKSPVLILLSPEAFVFK